MDVEEELLTLIVEENYREAKKVLIQTQNVAFNKLLRDGITILHVLAGQDGEEASEILEMVLQSGGDPNLQSVDSLTPVHVAAMWGRKHNLQLLLNYGGCAELQDSEGLTALDHSCNSQEPDSPDCRKLLNVFIDDSWLTEVSESEEPEYHTAVEETVDIEINKTEFLEDLDDSEVYFPQLHPWIHNYVDNNTNLDDTLVGNLRQLDLGNTDSPVKPDTSLSPEHTASVFSTSSDDTSNESLSADNGYEFESDETSDSETLSNSTIIYDWKDVSTVEWPSSGSEDQESICIPDEFKQLNPRELRSRLEILGEVPGPITPTTHRVYLKYLTRIVNGKLDKPKKSPYQDYISELRKELEGTTVSRDMYKEEEDLCKEFDKPCKTWREGCEKASFNYILLDPRATNNLPARAKKMSELDVFRAFVAAVFYIGKGKRSRPYAHLYEALDRTKTNKKVEQIRDIWQAGLGVISLHCFQNVIPVEAYTREACMVETFGLARLTNLKRGDVYGGARYWNLKKKREFGLFLLKRAMRIFLNEGERLIRPQDLKRT